MTAAITLRPFFGRVLTVGTAVGAAMVVGSLAVHGPSTAAASALPAAALAIYVAWLLFWQPSVVIGPTAVRLRNVLRSVDIAWCAIQRVDTRWALTVFTADGAYTAWAAPAPGRHSFLGSGDAHHLPETSYVAGAVRPGDIPGTQSGDAATIIRRRLESMRREPPASVEPVVSVKIHWSRIVVLVVLTLGAAAVLAI